MTTCTLKILILISSWWWAYYISSREYKSLIEVHLLDCIIVRNSLHYSEPTLFPRSLGSLSQFKTHTHIQCTYQSLTVALALQPTLPNDMWTEVEQCRFWAWALKDLIHFNCLLQLCHLPFEETPPPPHPSQSWDLQRRRRVVPSKPSWTWNLENSHPASTKSRSADPQLTKSFMEIMI